MADETTETTEEDITLADEIISDLTAELSITDNMFNATLLKSKVNTAIREVKRARCYPIYYTDEQIDTDLYEYYSNIRSLALYDYNTVGMEFQSASSESNTSRTMVDRSKCFNGVIPLSKKSSSD